VSDETVSTGKLILAVPDWEGTYVINESYRPIAEALKARYEEVRHVSVGNILFIENTMSNGKHLDKVRGAQIGKMPPKFQEVIHQLTGYRFGYVMELFKRNIVGLTPEQVTAVVYHEMRHIDRVGDIRSHDIEDWTEMIRNLGSRWINDEMTPNLLGPGVDWNNICGAEQQRVFRDDLLGQDGDQKEGPEEDLCDGDGGDPDFTFDENGKIVGAENIPDSGKFGNEEIAATVIGEAARQLKLVK